MLRHHYQDDLEAFTWSALVVIGIAIKDHKIHSKMLEHLFIMHQLAIAKKRKTFSKNTVSELQWPIDEGKKKSLNAQLKSKIEYLYAMSSGGVTMQNDYFKFTYTIEVLRNSGWGSFLPTPGRWQSPHESIKVRKGDFIFMDDTWLQECFSVQGETVKPFCIRMYDDIEFARLTFIKHSLPVEFMEHVSNEFYYFNLLSVKQCSTDMGDKFLFVQRAY